MPKTKQKAEYSNIKVPTIIVEDIQRLIDNETPGFRYRTPSEFIIETSRLRLNEFEKELEKKFERRKK